MISEKFFKKKAVLAVLAVVLVLKIISVKVFWLLPLLVKSPLTNYSLFVSNITNFFFKVGVGTAKKLVLKFLLFLFPALAHVRNKNYFCQLLLYK